MAFDALNYVEDVGNGFNVVINGEVRNFAPYTPGDEGNRAAAQGYAEQSFNALYQGPAELPPTSGGAGAPTGYPTGGTYTTREGPKTEVQLRAELQAAGYGGPWDVSSMLAAYQRAGGGAGAAAGIGGYDIYSKANDLAYKYAELAFWRERLERFELPGLEQDKIRDSMTAALQYTSQMGYMVDPKLFGEYMQGTGAFPAGTIPTLERERFQWSQQQELAKLMANPATLVQGLTALGNRPEQVSSFLQQSPLYQSLIPDYMRQYYQPQQPVGTAPSTTQQPFQFPQGYQLPVRQTLWDIQNQSPRTGLISSMMGFAGMNPENEWAKFYGALPKGGRAPLSRYF